MNEQQGVFRSGTDALLLAAYALRHCPKSCSFVELGCGDGLAMHVFSAALVKKNQDEAQVLHMPMRALGIDKEPLVLAHAAKLPVTLGVEKHFMCADFAQKKSFRALYAEASAQIHSTLSPNAVSCVFANPPYYKSGTGRVSEHAAKATALHQSGQEQVLHDFCAAARYILAHHGWFFTIYGAEHFLELAKALEQYDFGLRALMPVHTRPEKPARWVLACARKGAAHDVRIEPSLCLYARKKGDAISKQAKVFCPWL